MRAARVLAHPVFMIALTLFGVACHPLQKASLPGTGLPGNSVLWGKVADDDGQPIVGAEIEITGCALAGVRKTTSNEQGYYEIPFLPSGRNYVVSLHAYGYTNYSRSRVQLYAGSSVKIDLLATNRLYFWVSVASPMLDFRSTGSHTIIQENPETGLQEVHSP